MRLGRRACRSVAQSRSRPSAASEPNPLHGSRCVMVRAADDDEAPSTSYQNSLEVTIKRKSKQIEAKLMELGMEGLEERLSSATQTPAQVREHTSIGHAASAAAATAWFYSAKVMPQRSGTASIEPTRCSNSRWAGVSRRHSRTAHPPCLCLIRLCVLLFS